MKRSRIWSAKHLALGLLLVGSLVSAAEAKSRKFYRTKESFDGSQALTACARGYHMTSLWEIHEPSTLIYDIKLGEVRDDSGSGPPEGFLGWIRTGNTSISNSGIPGIANCSAWTTNAGGINGTMVQLGTDWNDSSTAISPWQALLFSCDTFTGVWCVSNK